MPTWKHVAQRESSPLRESLLLSHVVSRHLNLLILCSEPQLLSWPLIVMVKCEIAENLFEKMVNK